MRVGNRCVAMLMTALLLSGCGGVSREQRVEELTERLRAMEVCTVQAEISCILSSEEVQSYELRCDYEPEGACAVTVLRPESLAGITAELDGERVSLVYDGLCLPTGLRTQELCAVDALPRFLDALRCGYLSEYSVEQVEETECYRLCFSADGAEERFCTAWLRSEDGAILWGEIEENGQLLLRLEFTEESSRAIIPDRE